MFGRAIFRSCSRSLVFRQAQAQQARFAALRAGQVATSHIRSLATGLTTESEIKGIVPFESDFDVETKDRDPQAVLDDAKATLEADPGVSEEDFPVYLSECLGKSVEQVMVENNKITVYTNPANIVQVLTFLRDHTQTQCKIMTDITAVDYPMREQRFEVVYMLLSIKYSNRIHVKVNVDDFDGVPSCVPVFNSANWSEREIWDMFGIFFHGHPDLRRILTDYGFEGHPFRKDFPLTGFTEVRYDEEKKRVVTEPLQTALDCRIFDFKSAWQNTPAQPMLTLESAKEKK